MLKRITSALFEEDAGLRIELAVKAQNNNGVEDARFDYDSAILPNATVDGHPGCDFDVASGIRQFRALVVFDPSAPLNARYDLFQVNAAGTLASVGKSVTNRPGATPLIGFGIDGVAVVAPARRRARRAKASKKAKVRKTAKKSRKSRKRR